MSRVPACRTGSEWPLLLSVICPQLRGRSGPKRSPSCYQCFLHRGLRRDFYFLLSAVLGFNFLQFS